MSRELPLVSVIIEALLCPSFAPPDGLYISKINDFPRWVKIYAMNNKETW